jgi:hypothetical protein
MVTYYYDWVCAVRYCLMCMLCAVVTLLVVFLVAYCTVLNFLIVFVLCCYCGVCRDIARLLEFLMCCVWLCDWDCTVCATTFCGTEKTRIQI